jgi:hypothetical protein
LRNILVIALICLGSGIVLGQVYRTPNYKKFDDRVLHFGFTLGINSANILAIPTIDPNLTPGLMKTEVNGNPGFNLGFIGSLKLGHPTLTLRFVPTLSFQAKDILYFYFDEPNEPRKATVESTILHFPLLLKYRTLRYNNFAAYFIGGGEYSVDLQSKQRVPQNPLDPFLKLNKHDLHGQIGVGVDFFLPYFKFGLELKMSHGLMNALIQDNTMLSNPFDKLYNRVIWFSLTFEG